MWRARVFGLGFRRGAQGRGRRLGGGTVHSSSGRGPAQVREADVQPRGRERRGGGQRRGAHQGQRLDRQRLRPARHARGRGGAQGRDRLRDGHLQLFSVPRRVRERQHAERRARTLAPTAAQTPQHHRSLRYFIYISSKIY